MTPLTQPKLHAPTDGVARPTRLSAGVVVVMVVRRKLKFLLLRAYRNWDFPKGMVEPGEQPIEAAVREVREETTLDDISFDWGMAYIDSGPYNKGKISRYYVARSKQDHVKLLINPELGMPEHQEARWVDVEQARAMVSPRLKPVIDWAYLVVNHGVVNRAVVKNGQTRRPVQSSRPPA